MAQQDQDQPMLIQDQTGLARRSNGIQDRDVEDQEYVINASQSQPDQIIQRTKKLTPRDSEERDPN